MIGSLLVPLDGSRFAEHALPLALTIARRSGATVQLLRVLPPLPSIYSEAPLFLEDCLEARVRERQRDSVRSYLDGLVKRAGDVSPACVGGIIREGEIAESIEEQAIATGVDLVVMATHGRGPLGRFWLGSVADHVVRRLPMPVLLVRSPEGEPDLAGAPSLKHILVPLDGSPLAEQVLEPVATLTRLMNADVTLLRALTPQSVPARSLAVGPGAPPVEFAEESDEYRQAEGYLGRVAERLRARSLLVRTRVVAGHYPAAVILREAIPPFDLVALATHGRRGLSRFLLGSVADKVVRGAAVPVLVHRALAL